METRILKATHGSIDAPLQIGDLELPCYVLEDGTRVLTQRGLQASIGLSRSAGKNGARRTVALLNGLDSERFRALAARADEPIVFRTRRGNLAHGYEATILADICEAILDARDRGLLLRQQIHLADRCEILMRGFARVGIIALVDEKTGYQEVRSRRALEEILERYISKDLLAWTKMFPDSFYSELFRLRGWHYTPFSVSRPAYVGTLTNDVVYARLAPGVLEELKRITPKDGKGRRKHRYHQRLTEDVGHPRLREHLEATTALMRASNDYKGFHRLLQRAYPKINTNLEMEFADAP